MMERTGKVPMPRIWMKSSPLLFTAFALSTTAGREGTIGHVVVLLIGVVLALYSTWNYWRMPLDTWETKSALRYMAVVAMGFAVMTQLANSDRWSLSLVLAPFYLLLCYRLFPIAIP